MRDVYLFINKTVKIPITFYLKETYILFCRSMQQLLDYPEDDVEETFCLNFTVSRKKT